MREKNRLSAQIDAVKSIQQNLSDNVELIEMAEEEGDSALVDEAHASLEKLQVEARKRQIESLLSGEVDGNLASSFFAALLTRLSPFA